MQMKISNHFHEAIIAPPEELRNEETEKLKNLRTEEQINLRQNRAITPFCRQFRESNRK